MLAAALLAVDEVNAVGGVLGRDIELVIRDTAADPDTGVTAMEDLIVDQGVVAVLGEVHSSVAVAEIEVAHREGIPFLVADAWADEITAAGYAEVFRIAPVNSLQPKETQSAGFTSLYAVPATPLHHRAATLFPGSAEIDLFVRRVNL